MGPSGSGKSTLMHVLAGLDAPTSGSVLIDGVELAGLDDGRLTQLRRDKIGFIFQAFNLLPVLTAEENIVLPLSIAGRKPDAEWLERLHRAPSASTDRRTHRPSELSGGQQQRVAVARALVTRPAVVFADEPTGNLDSHSSADVLDLLRRAVDEFGQTVIMVTHDPTAAEVTDRIVELADGRIVVRPSGRSGPRHDEADPAQPRAAQAPHGADGDGDRPRRRDDQRHLHPHRHDRPRLRRHLPAGRRGRRRQRHAAPARSTTRTPTRRSAARRRAARPRPSGARASPRRAATSSAGDAARPRGGEPMSTSGVPTFAASVADDRFEPFNAGRGPAARRPTARSRVDKGTADEQDFEVGDTVTVAGDPGTRRYRLVGIARFGSVDSLAGATVVLMNLRRGAGDDRHGRRVRRDRRGRRRRRLAPSRLRDAVAQRAARRARRRAHRRGERRAGDRRTPREDLGFLRTRCSSSAASRCSSARSSSPTRSRSPIAQRLKELALLRTLGASRRQVLRSVVLEALLVGTIAALLGLAGGLLVAPGIVAIFRRSASTCPRATRSCSDARSSSRCSSASA